MSEKICVHCHKPFDTRPARKDVVHCSMKCRNAGKGAVSLPEDARNHICQICGKEFTTPKKAARKYCSRVCGAAARQRKPKECVFCHREFRPKHAPQTFCSKKCRSSEYMRDRDNILIFKKIKQQRRTDIEAVMEQCLQSLGVQYEWERRFGMYWVDFFLPDHGMAIECDGSYWHRNTQEKDAKRDAYLREKYHIRVQRFTDKEIFGNIRELVVAALAS
jgi:very-short-patch-repair endonuclease